MVDEYTSPAPEPPPEYAPLPEYAPPPPYATTPSPASKPAAAKGSRRRLGLIGGAVTVVAATAAVLAYTLLSPGSSTASTPQSAVKALLDAGMHNDVKSAEAVLCAGDRAIGQVSHLQSSGRITTYEIGDESTANGVRFVAATFATSKTWTPSTEKFPVVKENGSWKVCFSREIATAPGASAAGMPSGGVPSQGLPVTAGSARTPVLPTNLPGGAAGLCSGSTSSFGVASTYVGLAEIGEPQAAQSCVFHDQVPLAVTQRLSGKLFGPVTSDQNASVIAFRSTDASIRVSVTTAKEADGAYYVTAVTIT
jgi:hypothetical protein